MSPNEYLESLKSEINLQIESCNKVDPGALDVKKFTQRDYLTKVSGFINSLQAIVDSSFFVIEGINYSGETIEIEGLKCKRTEIEDLILIQPLNLMTAREYEDLMDAVSQIYDKGALNKMVLVLPYDVRFLKAKIKNK